MSSPPIDKDENNYYHPSTEQEIIDLVNYARGKCFQVRVRGSGHSMPQAIFTDECSLDHVDVTASAPDGDNVNIMLDCYTKILSRKGNLVTVEAGIHLGRDPNDPRSTLENSLLYQLHHTYGFAVEDLGGITHQTVAGFLSTGSSGGSIEYSVFDSVHALRFVDGKGEIFEASRDDANKDNFKASLISLGLLGVLSRVTFCCIDKYNIKGHQRSTLTENASVDIFDDNPSDGKTGLSTFLKEKEYSRIMWWPQTSLPANIPKDRLQVWQAERIADTDDFKPNPFKLFENTEIMMLYSYLMTLLGNIGDMDTVRSIAATKETQFKILAVEELMKEYGLSTPQAEKLANLIHFINTFIITLVTGVVDDIPLDLRLAILPHFTAAAIKLLNELDDEVVKFQDHGFLGLPMDNSADDILVPIMFTELWVPLSDATKATTELRKYFRGLGKFMRTGNNAWEMYASKASDAWLSMSYSDGTDVWKDGAFRIDPYWFIHNNAGFRGLYRPIWLLFKQKGIPFRLHWGKSFPAMDDEEITAGDLVAGQYPKLPQFLELRQARDPKGIFLSSYWRHWLGLNKPK